MANILIVRTDRLGDVLLTTPVSAALRDQTPKTRIFWLVQPYAAPLLRHNPSVDGVIVDRGQPLAELVEQIRREQFDVALVAYPRWRTTWAVFRGGIPTRIGPASKLYSALFTHRLWQHRSAGLRHEADYNLELIKPLGLEPKPYPTTLLLMDAEREKAKAFLRGLRVSFEKPVVGLHPGSGGSSGRWPLKSFMALGERLQEAGCDVVVTAGPGETYQSVMMDQMKRQPHFVAAGSVSVRELAALFSCLSLVVSNSTGPLHMAVALQVPTVSVYSPIATCHPQRWGPYAGSVVQQQNHRVALAPLVDGVPEMERVTVDEVWALCQQALGDREPKAV